MGQVWVQGSFEQQNMEMIRNVTSMDFSDDVHPYSEVILQGSLNGTHIGGESNLIQMVILRECIVWVGKKNDPCITSPP